MLPDVVSASSLQSAAARKRASPIPPTEVWEYSWRCIFSMFTRHTRALVAAQTVAVFAALLSVPLPLLMPLLVDEVLIGDSGPVVAAMRSVLPSSWQHSAAYILVILIITIGLRVASLLLQVWQTRQFTLIAKDLIFRIRAQLIERLGRVSMAEYESLGGSTVASHMVVDLNTIDEFTGVTVSRFFVSLLMLIGAASVLLWMHWQLGLFILFMNPVAVYFTIVISKKVKNLKHRENAAFQLFQEALTETLEAIQQIRAANREQHYLSHITSLARDIRTHSAAYSWKSDAASRFSFVVFLVGIDVFRALAMLMVLFSGLSLGKMIAVFGYLWYMLGPIEVILNLQFAFQSANAALDRINVLVRLQDEPSYPHLHNPFRGHHTNSLALRDVSFRYGDGPLIFDGLNLTIAAGEKVAVVGATGGGKSTLVQIILGLYPPSSGELYFDGIPVCEIGMDIVRANVGTVLQHPALFNDTVATNVAMGLKVSDAEIWRALGIAMVADLVATWPDGLQTIVGRDGIRLSGGQRQRLAIARMVLADPRIVVLDEATSALDAQTESRVYASLNEHFHDRTMLIIAHRLSAVRQADRILVFDGGGVVEEGSHLELLDQDGLYKTLYGHLQMR
jgi:ATP-binding cassette subfamily C protein